MISPLSTVPSAALTANETDKARASKKSFVRQQEHFEHAQSQIQQHVESHLSVTTLYSSGPNYQYRVSPDGKRVIVSGDVSFDVSPSSNSPHETLHKAEIIKQAALAPNDPTPEDRRVSLQAQIMAIHAKGLIQESSEDKSLGQRINTRA